MNSTVVKAFEDAWRDIQEVYGVPDVIIVVAGGGRKAINTYGHFASKTWQLEDQPIHEVLIVAEHLNRSARDLFNTLLHESVHALAESRGIKDVSGQRHNRKFCRLAEEMGMVTPTKPSPSIGFSNVQMTEDTECVFMESILRIEQAVQFHRNLKLKPKESEPTSWAAECECERKLRIGKKEKPEDNQALEIVCTRCGTEFVVQE